LTQQLRLIYPDTIIWNLLCDQNIDPRKLLDSLRAKGFTLVVSFHAVYELARNFERDDAVGNARGRRLFSYLKQYLDLDIPSTKQLWELIMTEDEAFKKNLSVIDPLATSQESEIEKREVEKRTCNILNWSARAAMCQALSTFWNGYVGELWLGPSKTGKLFRRPSLGRQRRWKRTLRVSKCN
jgi:hypothetical protein